MPAEVWDDRGVNKDATANCQACGMVVFVWVRFAGYGKGWQVCAPCLRDAVAALDEHLGAVCPHCGDATELDTPTECRECGREGCESCMPAGTGCPCPECEEDGS